MDLSQLAESDPLNVPWQFRRKTTMEKPFRFLAPERLDHGAMLSRRVSIVNGYYGVGCKQLFGPSEERIQSMHR